MSQYPKEDGYVIVELSDSELDKILDEDVVCREISNAGGYVVEDGDSEFAFHKDDVRVRKRAKSEGVGDHRLQSDGETWMALRGGVRDNIRWFQAGIEVRRE